MSGSKINDYSIGDENIQSVMLTLDKAYKGLHQVSLTNYSTTAESQIAAGSVVECGGALFKFDANESITGSPSDGTVYIRLVPDGDSITAEYTATAPTWSDSKQGWYGTSTDANKRYIEFVLTKNSSLWYSVIMDNSNNGESFLKSYVEVNGSASLSGGVGVYNMTSTIDVLNEFDNATNRFKPKKYGIYLFVGKSTFTALGATGYMCAVLNVSGSLNVIAVEHAPSGAYPVVNFSYIFNLQPTDYVILQSSGTGNPSSSTSALKIKKIG